MSSVYPFVRRLIPCAQGEVQGAGDEAHCVLTDPLHVVEVAEQPVAMSVYASLSSGLGTARIQLSVWHSQDGRSFRQKGLSYPVEVSFTTDSRAVSACQTFFTFKRGVPLTQPGVYEFRVVSGENAEVELEGEKAELRVLASH